MDLIYYIFGPSLYMDYDMNSEQMYSLAVLEKTGEYLLKIAILLLKICFYTSPIIASIFYGTNYTMRTLYYGCLACFAIMSFLLIVAICFRGIGRYQSQSYTNLIAALKTKPSEKKRKILQMFDFDFRWWPVDFDARSIPTKSVMPSINEFDFTLYNTLLYIPTYIFVHSVGIHLLYPGTLKLLQSYLRPYLVEGRAELVLKRGAQRFKLKTQDRNDIDTIFIDNRNKTKKGSTLVIISEGNMSFYSIGVANTLLNRSFSILGWNHPGFEGSTGDPFPKQEFHAIDAVIEFAIYKLNFEECDIMLYGWSIGGFSTICGASKYSNLKGLILDGTFDDVAYLACDDTPRIFKGFVKLAVRCHCNLNNAELLKAYQGPVLIVRRIYDETMSPENRLQTNRTNNLIVSLLQHRYPNIYQLPQIELLEQILHRPLQKCLLNSEEIAECWTQLLSYVAIGGKDYPMSIGENFTDKLRNQMAEFLLRKHCRDYHSSHCPPLTPEYFQIPWDGFTKEPT